MTPRPRPVALLARGLLSLLAGCGASVVPLPPVDPFLAVGVEPTEEAAHVAAMLAELGYREVRRVEGERFVAVELVTADERHAVRVVSTRGVVLALDSHEPDGVHLRDGPVELVATVATDLDGDGAEEVAVRLWDRARERHCLALVRIDGEGWPSPVTLEAGRVQRDACAARVSDVDGDGRAEVLVDLRWPRLALEGGEVPSLAVPLLPGDGAWRAVRAPATFTTEEAATREVALERARAAADVARAHRLGLELAALAHLRGEPAAAQLEAYDGALQGMVLPGAAVPAVDHARVLIAEGWRVPGAAGQAPRLGPGTAGAERRSGLERPPGHGQEEAQGGLR
ncbi:MAG: FG-GAP repeat domain-containing protein [Sandaracinaceae bacterium]